MIYGLYHSAAGMLTTEYRQGVIANNLANAETHGFKRDVAVFAERTPASEAGLRRNATNPDLAGLSGGLWLGRTHTDLSAGPLAATGNPLDVALDGPGFLTVEQNGQTYLTRDGRLVLTPDGQVVTATDGAAVLGAGGAPLRLSPRGGEISIDEDGRIRQGDRPAGRLALVDVADPAQLSKAGQGRYRLEGEPMPASAVRVRGGYVEQSGVRPIEEMVGMIEASRAYQINAQMVSLQDQTVSRLIGVVTA